MILTILSWITGIAPSLISLADKLINLQAAKVAARTEVEKQEILQQIEEVHDKRAVLVAEVGSRFATILNVGMRTAFAILAWAYLAKILLWDKVIGAFNGCSGKGSHCWLFNTDPIDSNMWWVILGIIGFYFVMVFRK